MAIGLGKMFGFHFDENFNYPYISKSVTEFWRRWHISLSTWFRDYVYIPLGGNRVSQKRLYFNLFVVWALTGLWHGANWTFICWGLLHFAVQMVEKTTGLDKRTDHSFARHLYTMLFVIFGWVLFRANNITDAFAYLQTMLIPNSLGVFDAEFIVCAQEYLVFLFFGFLFARPFAKKLSKTKLAKSKVGQVLYVVGIMALFIASISYLVKGAYNPFIYFNF